MIDQETNPSEDKNKEDKDKEESGDNAPAGFEPSLSRSLYSRSVGPFYFRREGDCFRQGFRVKAKHCNGAGIVHGGMLSTLADNTMAAAVYTLLGTRALTIEMNLHFMSMSKPGDWLEAVARVRHSTQAVVFCEADLFVGDRIVMTATGMFRRLRPRKGASKTLEPDP